MQCCLLSFDFQWKTLTVINLSIWTTSFNKNLYHFSKTLTKIKWFMLCMHKELDTKITTAAASCWDCSRHRCCCNTFFSGMRSEGFVELWRSRVRPALLGRSQPFATVRSATAVRALSLTVGHCSQNVTKSSLRGRFHHKPLLFQGEGMKNSMIPETT